MMPHNYSLGGHLSIHSPHPQHHATCQPTKLSPKSLPTSNGCYPPLLVKCVLGEEKRPRRLVTFCGRQRDVEGVVQHVQIVRRAAGEVQSLLSTRNFQGVLIRP